jgi:hypothetical protein
MTLLSGACLGGCSRSLVYFRDLEEGRQSGADCAAGPSRSAEARLTVNRAFAGIPQGRQGPDTKKTGYLSDCHRWQRIELRRWLESRSSQPAHDFITIIWRSLCRQDDASNSFSSSRRITVEFTGRRLRHRADCAKRQVLGPDAAIDIEPIDETDTRVNGPELLERFRSHSGFGLLALVGVSRTNIRAPSI